VTIVGKVRNALRGSKPIDAQDLIDRLEATGRFLRAVDGQLPEGRLVAARTLVERAGARLALSRDHTVVALAGSTGSGKSSLFNALARLNLSPVGVRRPTTGVAHSCVWGSLDGATRLLDWVGVLPRHRFIRESPLDADDEAALRGLVLLDLPDFDSVERSHRLEVDRLLGLVDLVVWVVDPQKYADKVIHTGYLRELGRHRDVTVVVLNQSDRLAPADLQRVLADLRRLVDADGLDGVPVLATSAVDHNLLAGLRGLLEQTVAERQAALRRLSGDVDAVAEQLGEMVGPAADVLDRATVRRLTDALAASAGVPGVVAATGSAYRHRAAGVTGWPLVRGLRRLRPDPLRRLHLDRPAVEAGPDGAAPPPLAVTSVPQADAAQQSAVGLCVRSVADRAAAPLPDVWAPAMANAARSRLADLPDALDRAVAGTDLGIDRTPLWWRVVGVVQWLCTVAAVVGVGWLVTGYAVRAIGLPALQHPRVGEVPVPTLLLLGGLLLGALIALLVRPLVGWGARRARRRAEARLKAAVTEVGREHVVAPVREVLHAYAAAREALAAARSE
jgi:energy-coupling factor transporter ATP-binding protein EcfA2